VSIAQLDDATVQSRPSPEGHPTGQSESAGRCGHRRPADLGDRGIEGWMTGRTGVKNRRAGWCSQAASAEPPPGWERLTAD
jgi:hypothetical protein